MILTDLLGAALEREFYLTVIKNIEFIYPGKFEFVLVGDGPTDIFKDIPLSTNPKLVFHFSDEMNRCPNYINRDDIIAVFKVYPPKQKNDKIIPIPLPCVKGFNGNGNRPIKDRKYDIFFYGQTFNWHRQIMFKNLDAFKANHPELNIILGSSESFSKGLPLTEYQDILENTKIAICPGGNNIETFRFTEAAKCGCVIIAQPKLNYWFYESNPQVIVSRWEQIHDLLPRLLDNLPKMQEISDLTKGYYQFRLSEEAVTKYLLSFLAVKA